MRLTRILFLTSIVLSLSFGYTSAQEIAITGYQTKGTAGSNAKLECTGLKIAKVMTVVAVTGDNQGFWITDGSKTIKKYFETNDPSVVGLKLPVGRYFIYPNLKQNQNKAWVKMVLK